MSAAAVPTSALGSSSGVVRQFCYSATCTALCFSHCWSATIFSAIVSADHLLGQFNAEFFECQFLTHCRYTLVQDEGIHNCHIKKEPEDILIILVWLHPDCIVSPELVVLVHTSHEKVVQPHCFWTLDVNSGSSLLPTRDCHFGIRLFVDRTETVLVSCHSVTSNCLSCLYCWPSCT